MLLRLALAASVLAFGVATIDRPAEAAHSPSTRPVSCYAVITVYEDMTWNGGPIVVTDHRGRTSVATWNWATVRNMPRFGFPPVVDNVPCAIRLR